MKFWKNYSKKKQRQFLRDVVEDLAHLEYETTEGTVELEKIKSVFKKAQEELKDPEKSYGLKTGYLGLDDALKGFAKQELIVVGGGTGQGKTQLVQCILLNLALESVPSLFLTFEMSPVEIAKRFYGMIRSLKVDKEILPMLPIIFQKGNISSLDDLEATIEKAIKKYKIRIVAIDHLHFFSRSVDNSADELGHITRRIKLMARKFDIPIILISHIRKLGRLIDMPEMDDLRGSSFISQDADTVIMIRRDISAIPPADREITIQIWKNRRVGILKNFDLYIDDNFYLEEKML